MGIAYGHVGIDRRNKMGARQVLALLRLNNLALRRKHMLNPNFLALIDSDISVLIRTDEHC